MATSSLFHDFVIEGEENVRRFVEAYESSLMAEEPKPNCSVKILRDPKEIAEFMERQHRYLEAKRLEKEKQEAAKNAAE